MKKEKKVTQGTGKERKEEMERKKRSRNIRRGPEEKSDQETSQKDGGEKVIEKHHTKVDKADKTQGSVREEKGGEEERRDTTKRGQANDGEPREYIR